MWRVPVRRYLCRCVPRTTLEHCSRLPRKLHRSQCLIRLHQRPHAPQRTLDKSREINLIWAITQNTRGNAHTQIHWHANPYVLSVSLYPKQSHTHTFSHHFGTGYHALACSLCSYINAFSFSYSCSFLLSSFLSFPTVFLSSIPLLCCFGLWECLRTLWEICT